MTTIEDLVNQVDRDLLIHFTRPLYDVPASAYNNSTSSIVLDNTTTLAPGAILDANFELMYVVAWNESTQTATVIRGFLGTTAAGGDTNDLVRINPRFPTPSIMDTILEELRSWDDRLFTVELETVTWGAEAHSVEISPSVEPYRLLYARLRPASTNEPRAFFRPIMRRSEAASQFTSGISLFNEWTFGSDRTVDLAYAVPFDLSAVTSSTSLEGLGLTAGMLEILKWGALARLVAGKEAGRLDPTAYGRPDLEQAVPASSLLQASAQYMRLRNDAFDREVRKLLATWPVQFS